MLVLLAASAPGLLHAQYSGTYTIGTTGHFTTIAAAFDSLELYGVNGPVLLELIDAAYTGGSGRVQYIPGTSDVNAVTLKPAFGVSPEITFTVLTDDSAAFFFLGTSYVTVDGSNNGTDSRDLTITVTSGLSSFNTFFLLGGHYITIKNCNIYMPATGTSVSSGAVRLYYRSGQSWTISNDILIQNNRMMGGGACVYSFSTSTMSNHQNLYVFDNEMGSSAPGDSIQNGLYTAYNTNLQIKRNKISVHNRSATVRGIYLGSRTVDAVVQDNEIEVFVDHQTTNAYGIIVTNATGGTGAKIFNNWFKGLRNVIPTTGTSGHEHAIRIENTPAGSTDSVAFNSIYVDGTSAKNTNVFGVMINNGTGDGNAVVMNNNIQMTGLRGTTGSVVGIARLSTYTGLQSDYNNIYLDSVGAGTRRMVGAFQTGGAGVASPYYTLADWQGASGHDSNSHSVHPYYASTEEGEVDLHLTDSTAINSPEILDAGIWLGETFAYDKDDMLRSPTPDIGSVEYSGNNPPTAFHLLSPPNGSRFVVQPAASEQIVVAWNASTDPDGDEVNYYFQFDTSLTFSTAFGENDPDTAFTIFGADFDWLANEFGVASGDSVVFYWRVMAYDELDITMSLDTFNVKIVREATADVFYAEMTGYHEVPPVYDYGYAYGAFALNADSTALHYLVVLEETAGTVSAAHFHNEEPGLNGPVVRTITVSNDFAGGTWTGTDPEPFTPAMLDALLAQELYVNVHTDTYPAGNVRGQVVHDPFWYLPEPTDLALTTGDGLVHIDWNAPAETGKGMASKRKFFRMGQGRAGEVPALTGYNVYRLPDGGVWALIAHKDTVSAYIDSAVTPGNTYYYYVTAIYDIGQSYRTDIHMISPTVGIAEEGLPKRFGLDRNYPNPFNPSTVIGYQLPVNSKTVLRIYNALGQEVRTLVDGAMPAGYHRVTWDGRDQNGHRVASGVYIYRLEAGSFKRVRKMLMVK
jgi:hypothetical protein